VKTRIHFEVLNLSKMVLNYRENFVESGILTEFEESYARP
jgi:hypothetical protein